MDIRTNARKVKPKTALNGVSAKKVSKKVTRGTSMKVEKNPFLQLREVISKLKFKNNKVVYAR